MSADSGVSSSGTISSTAASAAASAASAAASGISFSSSGVSEPKPIIDIDLGDMYWVLIVAVVVLLFALVRFLGSAFGGKRQSSSKVVCSLGNAASVVSIQGLRSYQEDKYVAKLSFRKDPQCAFFGVFDGHGGARASEYLSKNLHEVLLREPALADDPETALKSAFLQADRDFLKLADRHQLDDGSTAICVYLHDGVCYAANTGDSRCVLASGGQAVAMSSDHKPGERLDEKQRIEALGGKISFYGTWRVQGVLAVSRAFGDRTLKPFVIADPELKVRKLEPGDDFLILASDGVWDVMSSQEAVDITLGSDSIDAAAKRIVDTASARRSQDNITALIVDTRHFRTRQK